MRCGDMPDGSLGVFPQPLQHVLEGLRLGWAVGSRTPPCSQAGVWGPRVCTPTESSGSASVPATSHPHTDQETLGQSTFKSRGRESQMVEEAEGSWLENSVDVLADKVVKDFF